MRESSLRISTGLVSFWLALAVAGCGTDPAPEAPSWQLDVLPVIAANCTRCHSYPLRGGASPRLDQFDSASRLALGMAQRVAGERLLTLPTQAYMPPGRRLDDYEIAVFANWAATADNTRGLRGAGYLQFAGGSRPLV